MEILYLLIPIGVIILGLAIKLLFWAINSGQYDDLNTEGQRILFEQDSTSKKKKRAKNPSRQTDNKPE